MTIRRMLWGAMLCAGAIGCRRVEHAQDAEDAKVDGDRLVLPAQSAEAKQLASVPVQDGVADSTAVPGHMAWDEDATVRVFAPFAGRVVRIVADAGSRVAAGDTLALISSPEFGQAEADARRARADYAQAERAATRARDLFAHDVIARKDLEAAEADLARARAERDRTTALLAPFGGDTTSVTQVYALRAPLGGVVVDRALTPGQEVRPDQMLASTAQLVAPLFTISNPARLWLTLDLAERDAAIIVPGAELRFDTPALPGRSFLARVNWVAGAIDPTTRTVKARAAATNPGGLLRAEMLVTAHVARRGPRVMTVPATAVLFRDGAHVVYVDEGGGRLRRTPVEVGDAIGDRIVVTSGLAPTARVATSGVLLLEQLFKAAGTS